MGRGGRLRHQAWQLANRATRAWHDKMATWQRGMRPRLTLSHCEEELESLQEAELAYVYTANGDDLDRVKYAMLSCSLLIVVIVVTCVLSW